MDCREPKSPQSISITPRRGSTSCEARAAADRRAAMRLPSPPYRLAVLPVIRPGTVYAVDRQVVRDAPPVERRFWQRGVAREENALVSADRSAVHRPHI